MFRQILLALCAALVLMPLAALAKDTTPHIVVGQTVHVTLDKGESADYTISLNKGDYYIVLDAKRSDDSSRNIQATVQLLKNNGVLVDGNLLYCNEIGVATRVGRKFHNAKPLAARLRLTHEQSIPTDYWLTVIPAAKIKLLAFGYGGDIKPAKIGPDNGVGGDIAKYDTAFYSITLPPGKWSISLGLQLPAGERSTNLQGQIDLLTAYGIPDKESFVFVNEIGNQTRKETAITITKPKPILLRVMNTSGDKVYHYDMTIEKATD